MRKNFSIAICARSRIYWNKEGTFVKPESGQKGEETEMTDLLPAETGAAVAPQPTRHWKEAAAEGRAGRTGRIAREVEDCMGVAEMSTSEIHADRQLAVTAALADIRPGDEVEGS